MRGRIPSCSWEEKYDFTPKIGTYPGVEGVVVKKWWTPPARKVIVDNDEVAPSGKKKSESAINTSTTTTTKPKEASANFSVRKPRTARTNFSRRLQVDRTKDDNNNTSQKSGAIAPSPPKKDENMAREGSVQPSTLDTFTSSREKMLQARRYKRNLHAPPSQKRVEEYQKINEEKSRRLKAYSVAPSSPAQRRRVKPNHSYKARVKLNYSLPPSFALDVHQMEQALNPSITFQGAIASSCRNHPPPPQKSLLLGSAYRLHNRESFLKTLAVQDRNILTQELVDKYVLSNRDALPPSHDYNFISTDLITDAWEQRLLSYYEQQDRLYHHFVDSFEPIATALPKVKNADISDAEGKQLVMVRDDGHVVSPIELQPTQGTTAANAGQQSYYDDIREDEVAVLVRPFVDEIPNNQQRLYNEYNRVVSKGREWDRQYAIRDAVGITAQEVMLDLNVDPRYRQPGDYLLRRNLGIVS